uniref:PPPDE domain-containing protein n=1 Tax=Meloidogyne hapla TaxID=6305 RepID=A0A1I8B969_MELHA
MGSSNSKNDDSWRSFGRPDKSKVIYAWKVHCTEGLTFLQIEKLSENVATYTRFIFRTVKYDLLKNNCHDWALGFEKLLRSQNNCNKKCNGCKKYKCEHFLLKIPSWVVNDTVKVATILYARYGDKL